METSLFKDRYIKCLYFSIISLVTIGYGDIVPQSSNEMIYVSTLAILANGIFAFFMSKV